MVGIKYSTKFEDVVKRIKKLPELVDKAVEGKLKRDVEGIIKTYQKGIRNRELRLKTLNEFTIQKKREKGLSRPATPLYGKGDDEPNSLINALAIRKLKNGWKLYKRWAKHYDADLTLRHLLNIHEYGCIIVVTPKMRAFLHYYGLHLKKSTTMIRIPPRPVFQRAYQKYLRESKNNDTAKLVKKAINQLLKTGSRKGFDTLIEKEKKSQFEEKGGGGGGKEPKIEKQPKRRKAKLPEVEVQKARRRGRTQRQKTSRRPISKTKHRRKGYRPRKGIIYKTMAKLIRWFLY